MGATAVRQAVTQFLATGNIPHLNRVWRAQPTYIDPDNLQLDTDLGSGAVGYVHLARSEETRISIPNRTGSKAIVYQVGLVLIYQHLIDSADILPAPQEDDWVLALDETLDGIKARIRSDPTMDSAGVIWQAGEGAPITLGTPSDLVITRDLPRRGRGVIHSWNVIEFQVVEIIQA